MDRERAKLERMEVDTKNKMRKLTQSPALCAQEAKNLIRTRRAIEKFTQLKTHMMGIKMAMITAGAVASLKDGMQSSLKAMVDMNKRLKSPEFTNVVREFAQESAMMEQMEEMMGVRLAQQPFSRPAPCPRHTNPPPPPRPATQDGLNQAFEEDTDSEAEAAAIQRVMAEVANEGMRGAANPAPVRVGGAPEAVAQPALVQPPAGFGRDER